MKKSNEKINFINNILEIFKKYKNDLLSKYFKYTKQYSKIFEVLILTLLYYFAINKLVSSFPNLDETPFQLITEYFPFLQNFRLTSKSSISTSAEFSYLIYLLVMELVVTRGGQFGFSVLVRFHIIYVLILESILSVLINLWDTLFYVEVKPSLIFDWNTSLAQVYYSLLFWLFFLIYISGYIFALFNKFPKLPLFQKIPDSVVFWLRIQKKNTKNTK